MTLGDNDIVTRLMTITINNNGQVIDNNASDQPYRQGGDSLYQTSDNVLEIWNRPAVLMQRPIHPKLGIGGLTSGGN